MRENKARFAVERNPWEQRCRFFMGMEENGRVVYMAQPLVMVERTPHTPAIAFMELIDEDVQMLMDEIWRAGFRPTEGTGSAGALAAVERHLADIKQIAFHALKITGEKK